MSTFGEVYHPRAPGGAFRDGVVEAKAQLARLVRLVLLRGAALALFVIAAGLLGALLSHHGDDASLNNANGGQVANIFGPVGAIAADLLLTLFGLAAGAFLAAPLFWGLRAFLGKNLRYAIWRLFAWPAATLMIAGGLGFLPVRSGLPARDGGLAGIAVHALCLHFTPTRAWIVFAVPAFLLVFGVPLAFWSAGLRIRPLAKIAANGAGALWWLGSRLCPPRRPRRETLPDDQGPEEDEGDDGFAADTQAQPLAAMRLAERREGRIKREEAKRPIQTGRHSKQPALNLASGEYQLPALGLLAEPGPAAENHSLSDEALEENARMLEAVLADFGVKGRITAVRPGPVVTLYEFEPAAGVKSSRVISLADDVARSMSAVSTRVAVISGRNVIGIELPNQRRETVYLRELLATADYEKARAPLTLALGKTIGGEPVMADLAKMPHLLVAGTTGSGKSVGLNTMILSLLFRMPPEQCRMIMIDPKMLELSVYDGIPHLLTAVVTDPRKAVVALKWAVREMEERYRKMSKLGVRGVEVFNERVRKAKESGESLKRTVQTGFDRDTGKPVYEDEVLDLEPMPFIVVVVDEVADLMMISGKEIEGAVQRLAQMARAAGIHLIAATQRPSVDVITGTIKANFPTRISFQVTSKIDSRTILGEQGAEQLLGQGDMLYMAAGGRIRRVHGPFVSDHEVEDVVRFLKGQGAPEYLDAITEEPEGEDGDPYGALGGGNMEAGDDLYDKALAIVARDKKASTSYIQRRLQIGYNRAASLIERMEQDGVISQPNHKGVREVLLPDGER
ncbi:MAG: DNA translocase FtsK 4TM domain-containing protein [Rhizomicrobium sp.]